MHLGGVKGAILGQDFGTPEGRVTFCGVHVVSSQGCMEHVCGSGKKLLVLG